MSSVTYLTTAPLSDLVKIGRAQSAADDARVFEGTVRKHPYDAKRFLLIHVDQASSFFYEFRLEDVVSAEEVRQVVDEQGRTVQVVRVGVRRGSRGIEMRPFEV